MTRDIKNKALKRGKTYNPNNSNNKTDNKFQIGLGNNIMITELSENYLDREETRHLFELQFQIYYSENDFITMRLETYFRPKNQEHYDLYTPAIDR